jgi:enoyl-CoA hydratase/carnithine racemase
MAGGKIEQRKEDGILILEINNPPVNSYTHEMLRQLDDALLQARFDEETHVIVLKQSLAYKYNFALHGHEVLSRLENTPKLIVAAINGHAIGGGLEISMAADIRIAKKDAGRLGLAEVGIGVMPGMGGTQRLPRLVGKAKALELCATGKQIAFEEALDMGLIHYIYERENFMEQVLDYARQFIPPNKASLAVGKIKRAIQSGVEGSLAEGLALEREVLYQTFASEDGSEGVKAYLEKRTPKFKGR